MSAIRKIPRRFRLKYGYYQFFDHFLGRKTFFNMTRKSRTKFYAKLMDHLQKGGEGRGIEVDRVKDISHDEFMKKYVERGIPVILEGAAKDWECCKSWSLEYFKELHGTDKVVYMDQTDINTHGYEETTLADIIDNIRGGKGKYYRFYPLMERHPEHLLDFDYKWLRKRRIGYSLGEAFHIFISGKGGFTPLHNAGTPNIFVQAYGEKEWRLIPNHFACVIDPAPARNMYRSAPIRAGVDYNPFKKNFENYPLMKYVDYYKVHLKQGDVFYNPPYMWHCITNPTDSIGVGYRYFSPLYTFRLGPLYQFLEVFTTKPPIWVSYRKYADLNYIHLAESGKLKELKKKHGLKRIRTTVS